MHASQHIRNILAETKELDSNLQNVVLRQTLKSIARALENTTLETAVLDIEYALLFEREALILASQLRKQDHEKLR